MDASREPASLAEAWAEPQNIAQTSLQPIAAMRTMERLPTGWSVVEQFVRHGHDTDGVSTVLITPEARSAAFEDQEWTGRSLGEFAIVDDAQVELGLSQPLGAGASEFFCQVRENHGLRPPTVEIAHPYLWYWDAVRDGNDWFYLDAAGRERPLIRTTVEDEGVTVEVRALEFRRYLSQRGMLGLIQHDHIRWANEDEFDPIGLDYETAWCRFGFYARFGPAIAAKAAHSRLIGSRLVPGVTDYDPPSWLGSSRGEYRDFVIEVDPETGRGVMFTSDPARLADYFGKNPEAPHYLTRVHFDKRVLDRYLDDPHHYAVTGTRVSAVGAWSMSIGRTLTGDVEAYLGDLGRDLPWQEHDHWRAHNISPNGGMDPDKFRRDFLGEFAGSVEPLDRLREALIGVNDVARARLGRALFRALPQEEAIELERLQPPVHNSARALVQPVLLLTKALVDSLDSKLLRSVTGSSETGSLVLLAELVRLCDGDPDLVAPFRALYRVRSSGGIAHLADRSREAVLEAAGVEGLTPAQAVESLAARLASALGSLATLIGRSASTVGETGDGRTT